MLVCYWGSQQPGFCKQVRHPLALFLSRSHTTPREYRPQWPRAAHSHTRLPCQLPTPHARRPRRPPLRFPSPLACSRPLTLAGDTGPAGADGPPGKQGDPGPQGIAGADGNDGIDGVYGEIGETGSVGPEGPEGPQGDTGATGATGATGPQGAIGATGATGATGAAGPIGIETVPTIGNFLSSGSWVSGNIGDVFNNVADCPPNKRIIGCNCVVTPVGGAPGVAIKATFPDLSGNRCYCYAYVTATFNLLVTKDWLLWRSAQRECTTGGGGPCPCFAARHLAAGAAADAPFSGPSCPGLPPHHAQASRPACLGHV